MSAEIDIAGIQVPQSDWAATPESVKAVVTVLSERLAYIEEQLKQNSQNSSRPPSSEGFSKAEQPNAQKKNKPKPKKAANNAGSSGKGAKLYNCISWSALAAARRPVRPCRQRCHRQDDETGFSQGNGDGLNPRQSQGWLRVLYLSPSVFDHIFSGEQPW
jgi:hypothetical protein